MSTWKPGDKLPPGGIRFWFNSTALKSTLDILKREYPEGYAALLDDIRAQVASPVAMIDPEDREQVERLADMVTQQITDKDHSPAVTEAVAAALREFANPTPPRPDEPQGLGAVVEDAGGRVFIRHQLQDAEDEQPWFDSDGDFYAWATIAAVRVLSEGVTA